MKNYWDELMATDEGAANYMETYGEGPGSETRYTIGSFINPGESVLDVGCGPGWNYDHFQKYGPEVKWYLGLDYSDRFIRIAKQRHPQPLDFCTPELFKVGDVRDFKQPDLSWDVVIMQDVLEHTSGYEKPMSEALRVARKRIIVTFWRGQMRDDFENDDRENHIRDDGDDGFCGEYSRKAWENYLDSLDLHWLDTQTSENRWHRYYIIDKKTSHGRIK